MQILNYFMTEFFLFRVQSTALHFCYLQRNQIFMLQDFFPVFLRTEMIDPVNTHQRISRSLQHKYFFFLSVPSSQDANVYLHTEF